MGFVFSKFIFTIGILGLYIVSCRANKAPVQDTTFEISQQEEGKLTGQSSPDDQNSENNQSSQFGQAEGTSQDNLESSSGRGRALNWGSGTARILHPKNPTAWFTRRLLMTATQPSATKIVACRERVESAVADAPNLSALDSVALAIQSEVGTQVIVYHWCFYQIMADLDIRLENNAPLMQDKAEIFLGRMKTLWVLGRALDNSAAQKIYLKYLNTRYREISQTLFGRNLETVDLDSFSVPTRDGGKPATEFDE
jgi:hypothetical protein